MLIVAKNRKNLYSWIFALMFFSISFIAVSLIFYLIKLTNYRSVFSIENKIYYLLTNVKINFFVVRNYVNIGVSMFIFSKIWFVLTEKASVQTRSKTTAVFALGIFLSLIYVYINSFGFIEHIFLLTNDENLTTFMSPAAKYGLDIVKAYNSLLLYSSCVMSYVMIYIRYSHSEIVFKKKQYKMLAAAMLLVDTLFFAFYIFGPFKGKVFNNIELEYFAFCEEIPHFWYAYMPVIIFIIVNVVVFILIKSRILDSVTFMRNREILKKSAYLPQDIRHMMHSYKNSLFTIMIMADEIKNSNDIELSRQTGAEIYNSVKDCIDQVSGFLNISCNPKCSVEVVDIKECIKIALLKLGKKDVQIITDYDNEPVFGYFDRYKIADAIYNILINSLDAIKAAGRKNGRIKISVFHETDWICISVEDNGCGIPRKNLKKCFDPLFTTKKTHANWGIGLSYVEQIVKYHLGFVFADSKEGEYTQFQILLPSIKNGTTSLWE